MYYKIGLKYIMDTLKQNDLTKCGIKYWFDDDNYFRVKINLDEQWIKIDWQEMNLVKQPCHYGNYRYYMECNECGKKCTVVYGRAGGTFACNVCSGRIKTTLNRTKTDCAYYWERAKRIAISIDPEYCRKHYRGYANMIFPPRPKYMRMDKYMKLYNKFYDYVKKGDSLWGTVKL